MSDRKDPSHIVGYWGEIPPDDSERQESSPIGDEIEFVDHASAFCEGELWNECWLNDEHLLPADRDWPKPSKLSTNSRACMMKS